MATDARSRAREALRLQLAAEAYDVFAERGFADVTVDDIARETGISRATFFRYFARKEDAVVAAIDSARVDYGAVLRTLDAREGESVWRLILRAFLLASKVDADPQRTRARLTLVHSTPSLRAQLAQSRAPQIESLAAALAARGGDPAAHTAAAEAAFAVMGTAWNIWRESDARPFADVLAAQFASIEAAVS